MEERIRGLLRDRAEDVPARLDMPGRAQTRARRRMAFTMGAMTLAVAALVVGTVVGVRQLAAPDVPAKPHPTLVPITHHNGDIVGLTPVPSKHEGLMAIDPSTGHRHMLLDCPPATDANCEVSYGTWSPDGTKLAYLGKRFLSGKPTAGEMGIYVLDLSTGTSSEISPCPNADCYSRVTVPWLAWSPDGSRIAVADPQGISLMNPDGTDRTRLTTDSNNRGITKIRGITWAPDGARLAYSNGRDLLTIAADGSDGAILLQGAALPGNLVHPAWSPDGSKIAFRSVVPLHKYVHRMPHYRNQIWVMNTDGSGRTKLFETLSFNSVESSSRPVWSPDGTKLAFVLDTAGHRRGRAQYDLYVMNADGTDVQILFPGYLNAATWQPVP